MQITSQQRLALGMLERACRQIANLKEAKKVNSSKYALVSILQGFGCLHIPILYSDPFEIAVAYFTNPLVSDDPEVGLTNWPCVVRVFYILELVRVCLDFFGPGPNRKYNLPEMGSDSPVSRSPHPQTEEEFKRYYEQVVAFDCQANRDKIENFRKAEQDILVRFLDYVITNVYDSMAQNVRSWDIHKDEISIMSFEHEKVVAWFSAEKYQRLLQLYDADKEVLLATIQKLLAPFLQRMLILVVHVCHTAAVRKRIIIL